MFKDSSRLSYRKLNATIIFEFVLFFQLKIYGPNFFYDNFFLSEHQSSKQFVIKE